jgi:hypothetical protein
MAQKKSKKGKITAMPTSPGNYVRSGKARMLPIHECFMVKDERRAGIVVIVVVRKHVNGHLTGAHFLVDLWCLGVKDSTFFTHMPEHEYEMKVKGEYEEENIEPEYIDYPRAHTLIYGAVAFANKYGLRPHKSFESCRMVLAPEEELPIDGSAVFGREGKPTFVASEYDDFSKISRVIATLEKTAGPGNFDYIRVLEDEFDDDDEEFDDDEFDDEEFDDEFEEGDEDDDEFDDEIDEDLLDEEMEDEDEFDDDDELDEDDSVEAWQAFVSEEIFPPGEIEAISGGEKKPTPVQAFFLADAMYESAFPSTNHDEILGETTALQLAMLEMTDTPGAILAGENWAESRIKKVLRLISQQKASEALAVIEKECARNPGALYPYQLRCLLTSLLDVPLPEDAFDGFCNTFPGSMLAKLLQAYRLILIGKREEGFELMGHDDDIAVAFPEKYDAFFEEEILFFHTILCAYYSETGDVERARLIAHEMIYFGDHRDFNLIGCLQRLIKKISEKILEKNPDLRDNP